MKEISEFLKIRPTKQQNRFISMLTEAFILNFVDSSKKSLNIERMKKMVKKKEYFFLEHLFENEQEKSDTTDLKGWKKSIEKDEEENEINSEKINDETEGDIENENKINEENIEKINDETGTNTENVNKINDKNLEKDSEIRQYNEKENYENKLIERTENPEEIIENVTNEKANIVNEDNSTIKNKRLKQTINEGNKMNQ